MSPPKRHFRSCPPQAGNEAALNLKTNHQSTGWPACSSGTGAVDEVLRTGRAYAEDENRQAIKYGFGGERARLHVLLHHLRRR